MDPTPHLTFSLLFLFLRHDDPFCVSKFEMPGNMLCNSVFSGQDRGMFKFASFSPCPFF